MLKAPAKAPEDEPGTGDDPTTEDPSTEDPSGFQAPDSWFKINTDPYVTGADGKIALEDLVPGTYYLVETEAPEDYYRITDPIKVVVEKVVDENDEHYGEVKVTLTYTVVEINDGVSEPVTITEVYYGTPDTADEGEIVLEVDDQPKYGRLKIVKTLQSYKLDEPATFVFSVTGTIDGNEVYSGIAVLSMTNESMTSTILDYIPAGAAVTVKETYHGSPYEVVGADELGPIYIVADTLVTVEDDIAVATFINDLDIYDEEGHGIVNIFEPDEDSESGWSWTGSYPTTPTAGLPPAPTTGNGDNEGGDDNGGGGSGGSGGSSDGGDDNGSGEGGNDDTGNGEGTGSGGESPGDGDKK